MKAPRADQPDRPEAAQAAGASSAIQGPRSGPARVRVVRPVRGALRVQLAFEGETRAHDAGLALPGYEPRPGDQVFAFTDDAGACWVIGVLSAPRPPSLLDEALEATPVAARRQVGSAVAQDEAAGGGVTEDEAAGGAVTEGAAAQDGAAADDETADDETASERDATAPEAGAAPRAQGEATGPRTVHDRRGRLLFEYDPRTDRAVLYAAGGDLALAAPEGALSLSARDGVRVESEADVTIHARRQLEIGAAPSSPTASRVRLQPGELSLSSAVVTAAAGRAEVLAERVGITAKQLDSHLERARHVAQVVDVRAGRIVERAVDVYREASRLSQTRAGRLRLVAKKTAQLVGQNTLVKARERMKVKGERIHLA